MQNPDCISEQEDRWMEELRNGVIKLHREGSVRHAALSDLASLFFYRRFYSTV